MKRIILLLTLALSSLCAQAVDMNLISAAFKAGNASSLAAVMDSEVDMAIPGATNKCNAAQAVALLNEFFRLNKPAGFSVLHKADKKESGFMVAKIITPKKEYRLNLTYRTEDDKAIIQSIRIE